MLSKTVSKNVKKLRKKHGISQQKLANRTRLTARYISRLENSAPNITIDVLERLAQGLECTPDEIVGGSSGPITHRILSRFHVETLDEIIDSLQNLRDKITQD